MLTLLDFKCKLCQYAEESHSSNPPPFTKVWNRGWGEEGGIDFLKFGNKGGNKIFF